MGRYYNSHGLPTAASQEAQLAFQRARLYQEEQRQLMTRFPSCNSRWSQDEGGVVWCTKKSGGTPRSWVGVPRLLRRQYGEMGCVCVAPEDLDHPKLRLYEDCSPTAVQCKVPQ